MIQCSIKGCTAVESEIIGDRVALTHWVRVRACRCGAYDHRKPKACTCNNKYNVEGDPLPTSYWPMLDWWMLGGVEEVILCPDHKRLVFNEIVRQQTADPTMDSQGERNPTNRH